MLFSYTIEAHHISSTEDKGLETESGIIAAKDMPKALKLLIEWYGPKYFVNVKELYELENPMCLECMKEHVQYLEEKE